MVTLFLAADSRRQVAIQRVAVSDGDDRTATWAGSPHIPSTNPPVSSSIIAMFPDPAPSDLAPGQWKPNPPALWVYIMLGVGRILLSGADLVLTRIGVRR